MNAKLLLSMTLALGVLAACQRAEIVSQSQVSEDLSQSKPAERTVQGKSGESQDAPALTDERGRRKLQIRKGIWVSEPSPSDPEVCPDSIDDINVAKHPELRPGVPNPKRIVPSQSARSVLDHESRHTGWGAQLLNLNQSSTNATRGSFSAFKVAGNLSLPASSSPSSDRTIYETLLGFGKSIHEPNIVYYRYSTMSATEHRYTVWLTDSSVPVSILLNAGTVQGDANLEKYAPMDSQGTRWLYSKIQQLPGEPQKVWLYNFTGSTPGWQVVHTATYTTSLDRNGWAIFEEATDDCPSLGSFYMRDIQVNKGTGWHNITGFPDMAVFTSGDTSTGCWVESWVTNYSHWQVY